MSLRTHFVTIPSDMKYKREMYKHNPNIVKRVEELCLLLHNCNVYNIKDEVRQKYRDELSMWVEV